MTRPTHTPDQSRPPSPAAQAWDPALYATRHAFVWQHGADLIDLLAPRAGERVLDLGCGTGQLTTQLAERGVDVVGIDRSPAMIEQARRNFPGVRFDVADATSFTADAPFDAVFSNATLHWVKPPSDAVDRVWRALKPGGRFVAEFGGAGNVAGIRSAIRGAMRALGCDDFDTLDPWYFPTVGGYAGELERRGFEVSFAALFDRPTPLEGEAGLRDWVRMFGGSFLGAVDADRHEQFFSEVERRARPTLYREGRWLADYRRLRVVARKPTDG
jgi:trans-aconitate 2-methyltransferase